MQESVPSDDLLPVGQQPETASENGPPSSAVTDSAPSNGAGMLGEHELEAALQLLAERAQYITGATGVALALSEGEEMVCRASAGPSAPAVGVRLQVRSGLTGESIARKQLLRCDNAETDPRVNLETCRELGIASIVVMPLLTRTGEILGLFELFSDHAGAFEERDLIALERMADLTLTALYLAEQKEPAVAPEAVPEPKQPSQPTVAEAAVAEAQVAPLSEPGGEPDQKTEEAAIPVEEAAIPATLEGPVFDLEPPTLPEEPLVDVQPVVVPEAMARVQKCTSCGFPVSEGRTLCLDCEKKEGRSEPEIMPAEFVPTFFGSTAPQKESWLANHVNLLAILVLILSILVAVVVFR